MKTKDYSNTNDMDLKVQYTKNRKKYIDFSLPATKTIKNKTKQLINSVFKINYQQRNIPYSTFSNTEWQQKHGFMKQGEICQFCFMKG